MTIDAAIEIVSYKMGLKNGKNAKLDSLLDSGIIDQAIADQSANSARSIELKSYMQATKLLREYKLQLSAEANTSWLAENSTKVNVITLPSGLQYLIEKEGEGAYPTIESSVTIHYEGKLITGEVFDSSYKKNQPSVFNLKKMIKGWQEGLQLVQPGACCHFFIPQQLAYGERGYDSIVPPYSTLIFKVEFVSINT